MPSRAVDENPRYWREYSNLQRTKHDLIRQYLGGWFAKLGSWAGRVLYFDTHAGRGAHASGQLGSPLVALNTLLTHSHRDRLLRNCEFRFHFIERDEENKRALDSEVLALGSLPRNVIIESIAADCFDHLAGLVRDLREAGSRMAPAFVFVDPYGFKVPGALLRDLMQSGSVELFINVIWRELDMAIAQARRGMAPGFAATLDEIFGGAGWKERVASEDFDERADQAIDLIAEMVSARWATPLRMLADNHKTRYVLLHLTNHDEGRALMKDCMWRVCPEGGFYARKGNQQLLIKPEPNLGPLREWVLAKISAGPIRYQDLHREALPEIWRPTQINKVVSALRKDGKIVGRDYLGKFSGRANPLLELASA
ncbi:MAG: three-Cys-motif partner protein TcmP [Myxococcota bacterium]